MTPSIADEPSVLLIVEATRVMQAVIGFRENNNPYGTFLLKDSTKKWLKDNMPGKRFPLVYQNFAGDVHLEFASSTDAVLFKLRWYE